MLILKLAFRNILRQRRRSLLTGISMAGGYLLCALSFSLLEGSYNNVIAIFTEDHTGDIQIHKENYLQRPKVYKTIDEPPDAILTSHPDVVSFTPRVFAPALAYSGSKSSPVRVIGIDPEKEPDVSRVRQKVADGEYFNASPDLNGYYKAMIGQGVADSLNLKPGDEIILISQGADGSIANDIFSVSAVIGNRKSWERQSVYLPLPAAQLFLSLGNHVHEYALLVKNRKRNRITADELQELLPELTVSPWQVVEETFYNSMQSDKQGNHFTMFIIVFIVFIGVLNTVLMSVLERTREFGVLRAIGSRPTGIMGLIFLETMMLASISVVAGFILGMPLILWLTYNGIMLPEPIDMGGIMFQYMVGEVSLFALAVPAALVLGFAAVVSIPPGIRAARISPRDALGAH